jgi:hypothetical protein
MVRSTVAEGNIDDHSPARLSLDIQIVRRPAKRIVPQVTDQQTAIRISQGSRGAGV